MVAPREPKPPSSQSVFARAQWLLPVGVSVAIAALVFSVATTLYSRPPILRDALGYTMTAQRLVDHHVFAFGTDPPATWLQPNASVTPGYVVFLAGIYAASPSRSSDATASALSIQPTVQVTQFALALLVVALVAGCGFSLGGQRLAYLAGFLAALYLPFAWSATVALSECLAAALAAAQLLVALLLVRHKPPHITALAAGLGAVSAALTLVRPVTAPWIVVPFAYVAVRKLYSWKELGRLGAVSLAVFLAIMGGWWARNGVILHRFVALSDGAGNPALVSTGGYPLTADEQAVFDAADSKGKDPEAAVAYYRMGNRLRANALTYVSSRLVTAYSVVTMPWLVPSDAAWEEQFDAAAPRVEEGPLYVASPPTLIGAIRFTVGYQVFLLVAAAVSLIFVRRSPRVALVACVPVYFVLMHMVTLFINRYFFPAMPAMIVLAAAGMFGVTHAAWSLSRRLVPRRVRG